MYDNTLEAIVRNSEGITNNLMEEIHGRPETRHYSAVADEVVSDRISHVIQDVYKRLLNWLGKNGPKNLLFAYYSDLGATRCRQGMPLEEVAAVLLMIRRKICDVISTQAAADNQLPHDQPAQINYYVNLLFVGIIQSIITGYRNEMAFIADIGQLSSSCPEHVIMWQYGKRISPDI